MGAIELQEGTSASVDLQDGSDTGTSTTDDITNAASPNFTAVGARYTEATTLLRNGDPVDTGTGGGSLTDASAPEGVHVYRIETQGEVGDPVLGPPLTVTIDRTAAAPGTPDLDASSDLGTSSTDNLTSATTRTFNMTGVETGATVTLSQRYLFMMCLPFCTTLQINTPVGSPRVGNGSITESTPPMGAPISYFAKQTDVAGNVSPDSTTLGVTFDFSPPSTPNAPDLQAASDDGTSTTDNVTRKTSLTFDVTGIDSGATAKLIRADGESGDVAASRVGNGAITDTNVPVGEHTYYVAAMDAAGNEAFDNTRSIVVTVQAPPVVVIAPTTTSTTTPSTTSTTAPSNSSVAPAKASNPTPQPGDTVRLDSTPSGGSTGPSFDTKKPAAAVLVPADGGDDVPMPQPTFTTNADGSVSVSVQVPANTPPGVYLVAVVGTAPNGTTRVIIVPVVVRRRPTAASAAAAAAPARPAAVPAEARAVQASVAAVGGSAAVERAVLRNGATLSITGDRLVVDRHAGGGHGATGSAGVVGLLLAAVVLLVLNVRRTRSIR